MANMYKNRKKISVTLSPDTIEQLEFIAKETHCNKSQTITNLIWSEAKNKGVNNNDKTQKTTTKKQ